VRELVDGERVRRLVAALGAAAEEEGVCYLVGGSSAVLVGWRGTTKDVDIKLVPDQDSVFRRIESLKRELRTSVETASPGDFIPLPAGWEERSPFVSREGLLTVRHFDFYSQALAKLERGHAPDLDDVAAMLRLKLIEPAELIRLFDEIEPELYRWPEIDPTTFRARLETAVRAR
jgi:hypothetical protein